MNQTNSQPADLLLIDHASELLTCMPSPGDLIGRITDGSVVIKGEKILAAGSAEAVHSEIDCSGARVIDARGKILAPGFVDGHTHVVFGGSRVKEYAAKMNRTPAEVEALGIPTGITASMEMTRSASLESLVNDASARMNRMLRAGTTTIESKSGYGLNLEDELKMLRVNRLLDERLPVDVVSTFLGAHAFPPEIEQERYVDLVIREMIPRVVDESLAKFCDVYIDEGYFDLSQTRMILEAAREAGLKLKVHADQYSYQGGSDLAAELGAISADHLNYSREPQMRKLAAANVVGVLMPLIDFAVQHPHPFDARKMLENGMTVALATDLCPGGWTESMILVMQFACRVHRFSPEEALLASTKGGALALDLHDRGVIAPGMLADLQMWGLPTFEDVIYRLGAHPVELVLKRGEVVVNELS